MKRFFMTLLTLFLFAAFLIPSAGAAEKVLIAASIANQINQAWINMAQGIKEECAKMGFDLILVDAEDKTAKQISDTEDALTKNPKVLLLTGVDHGAAQVAEMAAKKGIPTINLGRNYGNAVSFIGADNYTTGVMFTEYHVKRAAGKEYKLIAITGTPGAASSVAREKGLDATLPKHPNIKLIRAKLAITVVTRRCRLRKTCSNDFPMLMASLAGMTRWPWGLWQLPNLKSEPELLSQAEMGIGTR